MTSATLACEAITPSWSAPGPRPIREPIQGHCDDACRILSQRWKQWDRLHARLLEADALEWRTIVTIISRRDPYARRSRRSYSSGTSMIPAWSM